MWIVQRLSEHKEWTAAVVLLVVLVVLSIGFETLQELLVESTGENFQPVVQSLFGELTVLGFVTLVLFVLSHLSPFEKLSNTLFSESDELSEISEVVHVALFIVILVYIIQVCVLVHAALIKARDLETLEADCVDVSAVTNDAAKEMQATKKKRNFWQIIQGFLRLHRAKNRLAYASLRHAFTADKVQEESSLLDPRIEDDLEKQRLQVSQPETSASFDFADYLLILTGLATANLVEIPVSAWLALLVVLLITWIYLIYANILGHIILVLAIEIFLIAVVFLLGYKVHRIKHIITPQSLFRQANSLATCSLDDATKEEEEEDGTNQQPLLAMNQQSKIRHRRSTTGGRSYLSHTEGKTYILEDDDIKNLTEDEHKALFWFGDHSAVPWIIRLVLLLQAICVSAAWGTLSWSSKDNLVYNILLALVGTILPFATTAFVIPSVVEDYVLVTSIAPLKKPLIIAKVVRRQKLKRSFRALELGAVMMSLGTTFEDEAIAELQHHGSSQQLLAAHKHLPAPSELARMVQNAPSFDKVKKLLSEHQSGWQSTAPMYSTEWFQQMPVDRRRLAFQRMEHLFSTQVAKTTKRKNRALRALIESNTFGHIDESVLELLVEKAIFCGYGRGVLLTGRGLDRHFTGVILRGSVHLGVGRGAIELGTRNSGEIFNQASCFTLDDDLSARADYGLSGSGDLDEDSDDEDEIAVVVCQIAQEDIKATLSRRDYNAAKDRVESEMKNNNLDAIITAEFKKYSLFKNVSPIELRAIASRLYRIDLIPGQHIMFDEEASTMIFLVARGSVEISVGSIASSSHQVLGYVEAGEFFGESILRVDDLKMAARRQANGAASASSSRTIILSLCIEDLQELGKHRELQVNAAAEDDRRREANQAQQAKLVAEQNRLIASLKPKQINELWALFRVFDKDGDGSISRSEIDAFLARVGLALDNTQAQTSSCVVSNNATAVKRIQKSIHAYGSTITFAAFATWLFNQEKSGNIASNIADVMFDIIDTSGDGFVTLLELSQMMEALGEPFSIDELTGVVLDYDRAGDGQLNKEEFNLLLRHVGIVLDLAEPGGAGPTSSIRASIHSTCTYFCAYFSSPSSS